MAAMASTAKPGKQMSSSLMNMKFMQRAAVSSVTSNAPDAVDDRPAKRVKLDNERGSFQDKNRSRYSALDQEESTVESKAEEVLARQAEEAGDTKWTLGFGVEPQESNNMDRHLTVDYASFNEIDAMKVCSVASEIPQDGSVGRRTFGGFNTKPKTPVAQNKQTENSNLDEDEANQDARLELDTERDDFVRKQDRDSSRLKSLQSRFKQKAQDKLAKFSHRSKPPRDQEVSLKGLTSLSGGISKTKACYTCGSKQHTQKDCPRARSNNKRKR